MFKVKVYGIGKIKARWLEEGIEMYTQRLSGKMGFEWIVVKQALHLEQSLKKEPSFICLDPKGKSLSSPAFSGLIHKAFEAHGSRLVFVIGGVRGIPPTLLSQAAHCLSLSPLTFTQQMTKLLLIEQLYRSVQIEQGTPYHLE